MATITSSIIALLAAAPEAPEPETVAVPAAAFASIHSSRQSALTAFERQTLGPADATSEPGEPGEPGSEDEPGMDEPLDAPGASLDEPSGTQIDRYGPLNIVRMRNMAGMPVPTSHPTAFPPAPLKGLFADTFRRRERLTARGGGPTPTGEWGMEFHGYLRAPFRVAVSPRFGEGDVMPEGQGASSLHAPNVPDEQYLSYQYTQHNARDWAELYLSYGNGITTGTVSLQGFNFSDASWKEEGTQFGIAQAYATLTPKFKARWARFMWKVGSFDNRYGASGRYDAGELETYLFGRTHGMGEAATVDFLVKNFAITMEHGFGATRPNPQTANQANFTLLHHAHVGFRYQNKLEFNVHWLNAFTREADRLGSENTGINAGKQHVVGPELRVDWGRLGYWYAGFSYIKLVDAQSISRAIEVIHTQGAGQYTIGLNANYLGSDANGNGEIYSVIGQVEQSIQKIRKGSKWYGQGPDLTAKVYFMLNKVNTDTNAAADGVFKYKFGIDLLYTALPWLGIGTRFSQVSPNSKIEDQRFSVLSPRLVFRTNFVTHETIELQYSRYFYRQRVCDDTATPEARLQCVQPPAASVPPEGWGATSSSQDASEGRVRSAVILPNGAPDENVFLMKVSMWW